MGASTSLRENLRAQGQSEPLAPVAVAANAGAPKAGTKLLDGIALEFGPVDLLGRFFLLANEAARSRGVTLSFGTLHDLVAVNRRNSSTWRPILPIFDPAFGALDDTNSFAILGHDHKGDVVVTQAARLYNWTKTNFLEEADNLGLFYPNAAAQKWPNERIEVTASSARRVTGRVCYSGGVWFRPDYRGRMLTAILPRISRACAYTRWSTDITTTIMADTIAHSGVAARCGYTEIGWDVTLRETRTGSVRCALLTMPQSEMLDDLGRFLQQIEPEIDGRIENGAIEQPRATAHAARR
jgi:hypothetical protein